MTRGRKCADTTLVNALDSLGVDQLVVLHCVDRDERERRKRYVEKQQKKMLQRLTVRSSGLKLYVIRMF